MTVDNHVDGLTKVLVSEVSRTRPVSSADSVQGETVRRISDRTEDDPLLSTASRLIQQAMSTPDVRMDKVAAVQQAISQGTYQVSLVDLADKLIKDISPKG